jgi:hypothetical protein
MKRETLVWTVVLLTAGIALVGRAAFSTTGMGRVYVQAVTNGPRTEFQAATPAQYQRAVAANPNQTQYMLSLPRTVALWVAALFTLAVFSFLVGDNPIYKIAEAVVVGVSAAYWMVVGFWDVLVPNLLGKIWPSVVQSWAMPGLSGPEATRSLWYVIPLILGIMLLWRLSPRGAWIGRWPLAFVIGTTAGLRMIGFLHGDFLSQIRNTVLPLLVMTQGAFDPWESLKNTIIVLGVLCCLVYFFFSFEHKGVIGKSAKVGIWVLMITFGASFGYTVMGRIALLAIRIEFLLDDWLWLIDPTRRRAVSIALRAFGLL